MKPNSSTVLPDQRVLPSARTKRSLVAFSDGGFSTHPATSIDLFDIFMEKYPAFSKKVLTDWDRR
jgi:hypothetical protein